MYNLEKLALNYYFSNVEISQDFNLDKMLKSHVATLGRFNTIINHLEQLPQTWNFLQYFFKNSKTTPNLTHSEINFADFRYLEDKVCLQL